MAEKDKGGACAGNCPNYIVTSGASVTGVANAGLSLVKNIIADEQKLGQLDRFKSFVDNTEWENYIASFKDLPGYYVYGDALVAYKNVRIFPKYSMSFDM